MGRCDGQVGLFYQVFVGPPAALKPMSSTLVWVQTGFSAAQTFRTQDVAVSAISASPVFLRDASHGADVPSTG